MRQIEEEGLFAVGFDKLNRFVGVSLSEFALICCRLDNGFLANEGKRGIASFRLLHVVGIRDAEVGIEAMTCWQMARLVS